jgi:transcriptional regulator with XRE-family HTH domain
VLAERGEFLYQVAGQAQVNPRLLGQILKGRQDPSPAVRERLAKALNVDPADIFEDG